MDYKKLIHVCSGNKEIALEVLKEFHTQTSNSIESINIAIEENNSDKILLIFHSIRPSLSYIGEEKLMIEILSTEDFYKLNPRK